MQSLHFIRQGSVISFLHTHNKYIPSALAPNSKEDLLPILIKILKLSNHPWIDTRV